MRVLGKAFENPKTKKQYRPVKRVLCDKCKKPLSNRYAWVTKCHSEWGEDSWESSEEFEVCRECVKKMFNAFVVHHEPTGNFECEFRYTKELKDDVELQPDGSLYFEDEDNCIIEEN